MDNVEKHDICTNVLSSQTFSSNLFRCIGKDLEGSGRIVIEALSWNLPVGAEEKTKKNLSQNS
jgi:hypothetical protein